MITAQASMMAKPGEPGLIVSLRPIVAQHRIGKVADEQLGAPCFPAAKQRLKLIRRISLGVAANPM